MARIATGSIVADIAGKVGDNIYSRNGGGPYVKAYAAPVQPGTIYQIGAQSDFAAAVTSWEILSDADYNNWVGFTSNFNKSGFNTPRKQWMPRDFFIHCMMNRKTAGFFTKPEPEMPESSGFERMEVSQPNATELFFTMFGGVASGTFQTVLYSTIAHSLGRRSINSVQQVFFARIFYNPGVPRDMATEWIARFDPALPSATERLISSVKIIHKTSGICVGSGWNSAIGSGGAAPYNIGNTDIRLSPSTAVNRQGIPVTTIAGGTISGIDLYVDSSGGQVLVGLYADSGGGPGARLAISLPTSVPTPNVWQTITFTSPFIASALTTYWICYVGNGIPIFRRAVAPILMRVFGSSGFSLPDPFGTSNANIHGPSIFATVTP